jgi:DNA polymerase III subunit delta
MRIFADRLTEQLTKGLSPLYLVFGNEPLLIQESLDTIEHCAKLANFEEIHRYQADNNIDWDSIYDQCQALSLFASRQIIEITLPESGANANMANHLVELSQTLNPDIILIVIGQKLTKAQENSKWFKALSELGIWVNCLSPDLKRLPQFVAQRCRKLGLVPDQEALQMLAQWHEGNLLALAQSLEKLALLYPDGQLTLVRIEESLTRHNHFTVFHWVDALLEGKSNRAQRILRQLKAEAIEPTILLRSIQKELLLLWRFKVKQDQGQLAAEFNQLRIWNTKRPLYQSALHRLNLDKIQSLINKLTNIEKITKTQYSDPPWPLLEQFSVEISHVTPPAQPSHQGHR